MMTAMKIENDIFYDETNNIVKSSEPDQILLNILLQGKSTRVVDLDCNNLVSFG